MPLVIIGLLLVAAKLAALGPVAGWAWWWVLSPFAAAVVWWAIADTTGITQRRAMEKMEERKLKRRERAMEELGLGTRRPGSGASGRGGPGRPAGPGQAAPGQPPGAPREPRL